MTPTLAIEELDLKTGQLTVTIAGIRLLDDSTVSITCQVPAYTRTVTVDRAGQVEAWTLAPSELHLTTYFWEPVEPAAAIGVVGHPPNWSYRLGGVVNRHELIFEIPATQSREPLIVKPAKGGTP